jgi:O-antigen/teichoic acid export membrane protein
LGAPYQKPPLPSAAQADAEGSVLVPLEGLSEVAEAEPIPQPVPVHRPSGGRSVLALAGILAGGNLLASVLRLAGGLLQARLVDPEVLGLFNSIALVLGYASFLHLGVFNGLNREFPYFIGKGRREYAVQLAAMAQAWALLLSALICGGLLAVAGWHLVEGRFPLAAGWATNGLTAFSIFYSTHYLQSTYRTSGDFARLALANVVGNAVALALLVLVALLSFYGLCLRALLFAALQMAVLYCWRPVRAGPKWNFAHLKHLLIIGLPIYGAGQLYAFWTYLDQTLVLHCTGECGLGLYAMVIVAGATLDLLPSALGQVLYPRMAEQFGRTESLREAVRLTVKPVLATAAGMVPVIALAIAMVGPAVSLLLPKYVEAIPAMQWSLVVPFLTTFAAPSNAFVLAKRQGLFVVGTVAGMLAYLAAVWLLTRGEVSLAAFPQAMIVGRTVYIAACYILLFCVAFRRRASVLV